MTQEQMWREVGKIIVRNKTRYPLATEQREGKNVVTDAVHTVDVQAAIAEASKMFTLTENHPAGQ